MPHRKSKRQCSKLSVDTALSAGSRVAGTVSPESSTDQNMKKTRGGPSGRAENKTRALGNSLVRSNKPPSSPKDSSKVTQASLTQGTPTSSGRTTPTSLPAAKDAAAAMAIGDGSKTATSSMKKNTLKHSLPLPSALPSSTSSPSVSSSPNQQREPHQQEDPPPTKRKRMHIEGRWTKEEDSKLRAAVNEMNAKNWKKISQLAFGGLRSDVQCLHRWQKVLRPGLHKGPWSKEEDAIVLEFVTKNGGVGSVKWSVVAAQVKGRLGKQVRERWYNHLDPALKKGPWEKSEDEQLLKLQASIGNRWCEIAKNIPGRSENAVKNRWNSAQRRARAAKEAASRKEAKAAELASISALDKTSPKKKKPRARRKPKKAAPPRKAKGSSGVASTKKRKVAGAVKGNGRARKRRRSAAAAVVPQIKKVAAMSKISHKGSASDLSVMADIGTALQMCEMRSNMSPGPSPSTRPTTPPTLNARAQQAVNITAANILAGAFERVAPKNQMKIAPTPTCSDVEDVAASALLGLFF